MQRRIGRLSCAQIYGAFYCGVCLAFGQFAFGSVNEDLSGAASNDHRQFAHRLSGTPSSFESKTTPISETEDEATWEDIRTGFDELLGLLSGAKSREDMSDLQPDLKDKEPEVLVQRDDRVQTSAPSISPTSSTESKVHAGVFLLISIAVLVPIAFFAMLHAAIAPANSDAAEPRLALEVGQEKAAELTSVHSQRDQPSSSKEPSSAAKALTTEPLKVTKPRVARFDNIRYLLSTMVCLCHFWSPFSGMEFMTTGVEPAKTYMFVHESMVMACFVLVSGMVASPAGSSLAPQRVRGSISLLTTFLLAQFLYSSISMVLDKAGSHLWCPFPKELSWVGIVWTTSYHMWFIGSLLWWRIMTPFYMALRDGVLPVAMALLTTVLYGYNKDRDRKWFYIFFYVFGAWMKHNNLVARLDALASTSAAKVGAVGWLLLNLGVMYVFGKVTYTVTGDDGSSMMDWIRVGWPADKNFIALQSALPWERNVDTTVYLYYAWSYQVVVLFWQCANCFSLITLTPSGKYWFSDYGTRTITSYIFHVVFLILWSATGIYRATEPDQAIDGGGVSDGSLHLPEQAASLGVALLVPFVLMSPQCERWLWFIIKPPVGFLFDAAEIVPPKKPQLAMGTAEAVPHS